MPRSHLPVRRCCCWTWVEGKEFSCQVSTEASIVPLMPIMLSWSLLVAVFITSAFYWLTNPHVLRSQHWVWSTVPLKEKATKSTEWLRSEGVYKESSSSHVNIHLELSRQSGGRGSTETVWSLLMSSVTNVWSYAIYSGPGLFSRDVWKPRNL